MIKVDENDPVGELAPTFPYRDVVIKRGVDMKDFYELEGEIGRGKFGTVYKCREKATKLSLAAKFVGIARRQDRKNVEREVEIMKTLQHPRLIQLYDAFETDNVMCVVLELIEGGELFERVIDDDFILTEKACTVFMRQICEGVAFIHSNNIIHLDLKPENILCLTKTGNRIKIIDFGLARKYEPDKKLQVLFGTPEFVAPEVVNFDQISCATDMWSVGVICYVLLSGLSPFMGETDVETMANVTLARYDFEDESFNDISSTAKDFISNLLAKDKGARLTAVDCLSHPWLQRQKPPVPPLETTKENLRNLVDKYVTISQAPIIDEKNLVHEKPRFIESIIENEHKIYNTISKPNVENEIPTLQSVIDNSENNKILAGPKQINTNRYPSVDGQESLSPPISKKLRTTITENSNLINNSSCTNIIPKDNSNSANKIMPVNINNIKEIKTTDLCRDKGASIEVKVESIDEDPCKSPYNPTNENPKPNDKNIASPLKSVLINMHEHPLDNNIKPPIHKNITSNILKDVIPPFNDTTKLNSNIPKPTIFANKTLPWNSNFMQNDREKNLDSQKISSSIPSTPPISIFPSASTGSNEYFSKLSFHNNQNQVTSRTIENISSFEVTRHQTTKNKPNEGLNPDLAYQDTVKGNDPLPFKQHLRSTPPWFSELSNARQNNTNDRFERRSSDFSCFLNSKEDSMSLNLADEIRKLSARLLQMSNEQSNDQSSGAYNTNPVPSRSRNDPIGCFLENHGISQPRPKFKFSNLNRDVPIGSPPPPSNIAYYLNVVDKKDSQSAPDSPRASPEKFSENSSLPKSQIGWKSESVKTTKSSINFNESTTTKSSIEKIQVNRTIIPD